MAIGTLALCYNNPAVFTGVVKLRRGLSAKVMDRTRAMEHVYRDFLNWTRVIKRKVRWYGIAGSHAGRRGFAGLGNRNRAVDMMLDVRLGSYLWMRLCWLSA